MYSFVIYPTWKTHRPHYIAICDLTDCTSLSHKRLDFRKNKSTNYVSIFSTSWSEHFKYIQLHIVINVQRLSWNIWLFCEFLIQVVFFTLTFGNCTKTLSDERPNFWSWFILTGRKDMKKPVFVSIKFAFAPKRYIHITSYTTSIQIFLEILAVHQTNKNSYLAK